MKITISAMAILVATLFAPRAAAQNLVINEIMAANLGEAIDPSWNFGGWVELYNPSSRSVSLEGMSLSDHKGRTFRLKKDHGSVPAGGFACLWFGHNDKDFPLQVDYKLDCDGGSLSLLSSSGEVVAAVTYPAAVARTSWGRTVDGGDLWAVCSWPTPKATNGGAPFVGDLTAAPVPTHPGGWIDGSLTFSVSVDPGARLYYTTDGTVPTLASPSATLDADAQASFTVSDNAIYRFRAVRPGCAPSAVVTRSFITRTYTKEVHDDWWGWDDWGWDGWPTTEETTTFAGFSLLSVVCDPDYLYDDKIGIYVDGTNGGWSYWGPANYYRDWDRPVNVEIYDPEGLPLVNQEVDMSMSGGYSRMNDVKSFKLKSDKKYDGNSYFPLTGLFPEKPYARYKDILVRAGGATMEDRHQDNALQYIARSSGFYLDTQAMRPVYVFLNGEYLETIFLREPSNRQYGYSNYGMDTDAMDTLEESDITGVTLTHGTWDAFNALREAALLAPADDEQWRRVQELLDVDEMANYFALELFLANQDWPQNNIKMYREDNDAEHAGRYRVVLQDLDACFHESGNTFDRLDQYEYYPYASAGRQENILLTLFLRLMQREEFRQRFVDAFCLVAGSVFEPQAVAADLDALATTLSHGYVEKRSEMLAALSGLRNQLGANWAKKRLEYLGRWKRAGLTGARSITATIGSTLTASAPAAGAGLSWATLNGQTIPRGHFSGTLYLPVVLEAHPIAGKEFRGWTRDGKQVSADARITLTQGGDYVALYRDVPDAAAAVPVVVNEVCADNGYCQSPRLKRSDWIELYNVTDADYDVEGLYISDDEADPRKCRLEAATLTAYNALATTVIPAHGRLVLWADDHQLPFKLANSEGAAVVVTAPDGSWSNTLRYVPHDDRKSVGRWPDGGETTYVMDHPTVGTGNVLTSVTRLIEWPEAPVGIASPLAPDDGTPSSSAPHPALYDVQGRPTHAAQRGIYVKDGTKYLR